MNQFIHAKFTEKHELTIGVEFASKIVTFDDGVNVKLQIWDTAGQEQFRSVTRGYYRGAICCVLVYDITKRRSFRNIKKWLEDVQESSYEKVHLVLIGNKADLDAKRDVTIDEGSQFARLNNMVFMECSALTSCNIDKTFISAAKLVYLGVVTMKYEPDASGEIPGVKQGTASLTTS